MSRFSALRAAAAAAAIASLVAACSSGQNTGAAPGSGGGAAPKTGKLTIALLQKQGDQQYFVDEAAGAKQKAQQLGNVDVKVIDLGTDANKAISQLDAVIAQKVDGIVIVVPDQQIGPQVIGAAKNAGIPLMAADDAIKDGTGAEAPFVGFDGTQMGNSVGTKAGELFKSSGWSLSDTRVIESWKQDLQTCSDRVKGAEDAFKTATGGDLPQQIKIGTDNSVTDAQNKASAVLTSNQNVKHWLVWGCNDENETGVVTALQNGGVSPDSIIGVGLGAYLTCKDWGSGQTTGNKAALFIDGHAVGAASVDALVAKIRKGTPLPPTTVAKTTMVDASNYKQAGVKCS
jgi:L-arabinose transport system substrate-binding protein